MNNYDAENVANPVSASGDTGTTLNTPLGNFNQKDVLNFVGDNQGVLIGFLAGVAVGATAALLFAPSSGREIRNKIVDQASTLKTQVVNKASKFKGGTNRPGTTSDDMNAVVGNS